MGLFSNKTKEEKLEASLAKQQLKDDIRFKNEANKEKLKKIKKEIGVKSVLHMNINDDTGNIISRESSVTLYVLKDYTLIMDWMPFGRIKSTYDDSIFNFIDIEWIFDMQNKGKNVVGRSIAGAMLAGTAGMFVGGLSGKEQTDDNSIALLTIQNKETHEVRMLSFECTAQELAKYKMIPKKTLIEDVSAVTKEVKTPEIDVFDQLKKLKELLDLDIITQDEFNQKKAQLLAL